MKSFIFICWDGIKCDMSKAQFKPNSFATLSSYRGKVKPFLAEKQMYFLTTKLTICINYKPHKMILIRTRKGKHISPLCTVLQEYS